MQHRQASRTFFAGCIIAAAGLLASTAAWASAADDITISDAWVRLVPGNAPSGAYAKLVNASRTPHTLESVTSAQYGSTMLHETTVQHGVNQMRMVAALPLPADAATALQPDGYHLMLMQPKSAVKVGDSVALTFKFEDGSTKTAKFTVRPLDAAAM